MKPPRRPLQALAQEFADSTTGSSFRSTKRRQTYITK